MNKAFTFVEIMIVVVIMALGLIPLFSIFVSSTSDVSNTVDELLAVTYANELVDSLMSRKFDEIPAAVAETELAKLAGSPFFTKVSANLTPCSPVFKRFIEIDSVDTGVQTPANISPTIAARYNRIKKFKIIKVRIAYSSKGRARELNMATIVTGA